jgi:hypothetical protein
MWQWTSEQTRQLLQNNRHPYLPYNYQFGCYRAAWYLLYHYLLPHEVMILSLDDVDIVWSTLGRRWNSLTSTRTQDAPQMTQQLHMLEKHSYFYFYSRKHHINLIKFLTYSSVTYAKECIIKSGIWNILRSLVTQNNFKTWLESQHNFILSDFIRTSFQKICTTT